ncbi:ATP synthase subunit I [Metabacillus iocasae]|uniref:ATP synthase protein I n=1 Tax=Priestia iocasae TaxID=2291674 RepID=A0ABS2QZB0_9BACI|nr:ATP synthase subunit I [Metabacillus iocasae]MBM7704056.1 ATP synthase protein I [Metabacillus iocasae]
MQELHQMFPRLRSYIFYLLALYVLGWGFTSYQSVFLGLILGTVLSLYSLWVLVRRSKQFGQAVEEGRRPRSVGTFARFASAALAVIIAMRYPTEFHIVSVVLGLMTSYLVIIIDLVVQNLRKRWEER